MEEYTFNSENNFSNNENNGTEPQPLTFAPEPKPGRSNGTAKKVVLSLGTLLLVIAISLSSGFIGAYYMVENRLDEIEDYYEELLESNVNITNDIAEKKPSDKSLDTQKPSGSPLDSIIASQNSNVTNEQVATVSKTVITNSYATVAAKVKDSVVEITTEMAASSSYFQQFIQSGAGSGVIISKDGYIVTNHHVIDGATKITVRLTSGDEYEAELIGSDSQADIAVLKIEVTDNLAYAVIGDSSKLAVGEEVLAIGNPLGELGGSVTNGIISALDRELTIDGQTMRLLQTNAAINPGNSGGGLFNLKGELIAIVNAKSSGTGIEGLGFAIPINYAYEIASELLTNGYVSGRPALGISYIEISNYMDLMRYGVSSYGIYVYDGGETTLKNGDRIISFGEYEVSDSASLKNAIQQYKVGDTVELMVARNGRFTKVDVTLIESKPQETTEPKLEINK